MCECRLCLKTTTLSDSHIIPKMFYRNVMKNSVTGKMRYSLEVNRVVQDGVKVPFLCEECEKLFSKYETYFSNNVYQKIIKQGEKFEVNSRDDNVRYFILSVTWRYLKWYYEVMPDESDYTKEEINKIKITLSWWREILLNEDLCEIRKNQMFLIPYEKISSLNRYVIKDKNGVSADFRTLDKENDFKYATFFLKVPSLIIMCTLWGKTKKMKQFEVGKNIKVTDSVLPELIHKIFEFLENGFIDTASKISQEQINKTIERYERRVNNNKTP